MSLPRLIVSVALVSLLAACDNSPKPPPAQQAATPAAPAPATAAAPASPSAPAVAASNEATAPLMGSWAADLAACGSAAITISATRFDGAENKCEITSLTDNGDGSFTANLSCTGEGAAASERISMRPLFAPTGEGIGLTYLDRGNTETTVLRCGPPQTASAQ